ncbi:thermonuclease family protein [Planifilum fimeticola]|uniref:thermonuclease family protein n=1 Tax=Planifilum fimeticola TaxID=201975 RepID=UPI00147633D5
MCKPNFEIASRDRGTGFVYVNDEDIALLLLREGYLKVYPSDWEIDGKKMRDKLQTYQRAEELAMEEDKGIWGKFD